MEKALLINPVSGERYLLENSVVMGCDGSCSLPFADWDLAPVHASINKVGNEWHLSDLGAANGLYLNYARLPEMGTVRLVEGDSIRMGNTELFFTEDPEEIRRFEQSRAPSASEGQAETPNPDKRLTTTVEDAIAAAGNAGAQVQAPPVVPEEKPVKAKAERKKLSKGKLIALCSSVAAVIILLFGWCLLFHLQGNSRMEAKDYPGAVSAYKKDFLFSRSGYRDAVRQAGEQAFEAQEYEVAASYFQRLGAEGESRRADCILERAKQLIEEGKPQEAIDHLQPIADQDRAAEQIDVARLAIAQQYLDAGDYENAAATAEQITHTSAADPSSVLDACYCAFADQAMDRGDYSEACDYYDKCRHTATASVNGSILRALLNGDACGAAQLADHYLEMGLTNLTREQWQNILAAVIGSERPNDLEERLRREAADVFLAEGLSVMDDDYQEILDGHMGTGSMVGKYYGADDEAFPVPSMEELTGKCGANPQGKILIVGVRHDYPGKEETYAVLFGLMRLLPKDRYPVSLDEVEYVVVISFDCTKYATYQAGTVALRENGRITVKRLSDGKVIVNGGLIQGDYAPTTIYYSGNPPVWRSGGAPDMSRELYQALKKILEQ